MANRVPAYHSVKPNDPKVHHVFSDCHVGNNIDPGNKRQGDGGHPRCQRCRDMGA